MVTMVRAAALSHFSDVMHALGGDPDKALRQAACGPPCCASRTSCWTWPSSRACWPAEAARGPAPRP
jgi:hypothetical protein